MSDKNIKYGIDNGLEPLKPFIPNIICGCNGTSIDTEALEKRIREALIKKNENGILDSFEEVEEVLVAIVEYINMLGEEIEKLGGSIPEMPSIPNLDSYLTKEEADKLYAKKSEQVNLDCYAKKAWVESQFYNLGRIVTVDSFEENLRDSQVYDSLIKQIEDLKAEIAELKEK